MKRSLHFYKWFVAVVVLICITTTMSAQTKVTSLSQLKAGSVIKIYPKDSNGTSHYGESKYALACSGDGLPLTSYEKAGSGDEWTLEDAGDGLCYLKNDKGCYWTYQGRSSDNSLECTMDKNSAVKIYLSWNTYYSGVCFWNSKDDCGLNNLYGYNYLYNWWTEPDKYSGDANTTFDIAILSDGNGEEVIKPDEKNIVTSLSQLKAGSVIKIYPKDSNGTSHYGESKYALACSGDGQPLTAYEKAGSGDKWTLEDAGNGYYYLKNDKGCYWAYQRRSSSYFLECTVGKSSAVKISLTWDTKYSGVCFWNKEDGSGLNNLMGSNYCYNWWSEPDDYSGDANTTFDIALLKEGSGNFDGGKRDIVLNGIKYRLYPSKNAKVLKNDYSGYIVIPETVTINNITYKVKSLERECFKGCSSLTSIKLPSSITSLEDGSFSRCSSLKSINLPSSITSLGIGCFYECSSLTSIELPSSITSLENSCFENCSSLTSIELPSSITSLESSCFRGCSSLASINLPSSITSLEDWSFSRCSSLKSINLPSSITSLGIGCFYECSSLTSINLPSSITSLKYECFYNCSSLASIELPSSITSLGENCFAKCSHLTSMLCLAVEPPSCILYNYTDTHNTSLVNNAMRLYVPKESIEEYKQSDAWNSAKGIYPLYPTSSVSLAKEVSVIKAKPTKLEYTIMPENAGTKELEWSSENPEVATVDANGIVTGKKIGKTVITGKTKDGTDIMASTTFTVLPLKVETMTFAEPSVSIVKTEDKTIKLTLNSEEVDNKRMIWTSSDESVATVVQNMNAVYPLEAIVVAHKVGKATIKAEAQDGSGVSATCEVEVTPLMASNISLLTASVVKTIPTQLEANVSPAEADNKKLKWTSLTPDIATVTEDGTMTGLKMGTAKVKAETTDGSNLSCVFEVQVTGLPVSTISLPAESSIIKTESMKLEYSILPLVSDNQKLKWSSNATDIASVDENTGVITAHKVGDAVITATATDGSGISASTKIHVTPLKISQIEMSKEMSLLHSLSKQIAVTFTPELADNKTLRWTSDNEDIATVTQEGVVTGVNVGSANITATTTDGTELSATCKVTVNPVTIELSTNTINLQKGSEYVEQTATILPENYEHKDVVWTTSGNGVASVDKDGHITANKPGVDTLRCSLSYDSHIYSECRVIVYEDTVVYVGGLYYLLKGTTDDPREATVTSIYGGKNTSLDAKNVAQYYSGTINIPETIIYDGNKYTVRKVGSYAFNCQNELQSIYIPRTVTEIEPHAAIKAEKLNRVNVADESQLENIGEQAFKLCIGLKRFVFDGTSLKLNTIGYAAFNSCTALEKVQWNGKSELKTIKDYAFFKCTSLNNFNMPNSTLSVGNSAFRYNESLTDINLSASLNYIDEYAFGECGFSHITLPEPLANIQAGAFINNEHLQEITLPERLQGLGSAAFENNSKLESVTFHTALETMTIGNNAFNQCPILNKVYITNMKSFAQTNFNNAKANPANTSQHIYDANGKEIVNVVLPKGTKYVNNNAFNGCAFIESIEMPATMDHVNDDIFVGCSALKDVYCYAEEVPEFIGVNNPANMDDVFQQATLHVIYGNEEAYKADAWWKRFYKIEGCNAPSDAEKKVTSITISQTEATLKPNDTMQLEATVYPTDAANKKILWTSSNEDVAIVTDEGFVLAITEGEADIIAEASDGTGIKAMCHLTVENEKKPVVPILEIKFEKSPVTIVLGESKKLNVLFNPVNASNKTLQWKSVNSDVASVDKDGNVLGVSAGKSIIQAKTTDGSNLTINCVVTVIPSTSIGNISMGDVKLIVNKRHLKVEGLSDNDVIQVVNTIGYTVYRGTEHEVDLDAAGIYIIKVKGKTLKFSVK